MVIPYHVTGSWVHVIDDGIVDEDSLPDEALPSGSVTFVPLGPAIAVAGNPATAYTVSETKGIVIEGVLHDLQGREGVWLPGEIGGQPVRWQATTTLQWRGQPVPFPVLEFDLTEDARLTGVLANTVPGQPPLVIDPRIEGLVQEAWEALGQAQAAIDGLEASEANAVAAAQSAAQSRDDAAAAAASAGSSATAAHDSATAAAGSASAAAGSATSAGEIRDQTVTAAQTVTDNLDAIEAAPGHATAAATARQGAEDARDAAEGHASGAAGSASAAGTSEANADSSAQAASDSATAAETARQAAVDAQTGAVAAETAAGLSAGQAQDERVLADDAATRADSSATDAATDAGRAAAAASLAESLRWVVRGTWEPGSYEAGDVVVWDERAYYAQTATSVEPPAQPWVPLAPAGGGGVSHWDDLDGKPTQFPPATHAHDAAEVSGDATPALDVSDASVGDLSVAERFTAARDASLLEGALGADVDASDAVISMDMGSGPFDAPLGATLQQQGEWSHVIDASIAGLQSGKADAGAENTAEWGSVSGRPSEFPPEDHRHPWADLDDIPATFPPETHTHTKAQVGLGNVDNTSDADKPVSSAQRQAIDARPAMWLWDGIGSWSPPAAANSGDSVLNLDSGEIHSITEV